MSRTSWVAAAIIRARNNDGATACENARTLAAEVERLEAEQVEAMCCLAKHAREAAHQKQRAEAAEAESARRKRNEELQMERAIKAEVRVKELDKLIGHISLACGFPIVSDLGQVTDTICKRIARVDAKVAELEAQNARLRAALSVFALLESDDDGPYILVRNPRPGEIARARELMIALNGEEASK